MDKTKLNRFYLSEKFDEDRNISFNLKKQIAKNLLISKLLQKALRNSIE